MQNYLNANRAVYWQEYGNATIHNMTGVTIQYIAEYCNTANSRKAVIV